MIPKSKKNLLCKFHNNICEQCKNWFEIENLHIHRLIRKGDFKDHRILKVLCKSCHKLYHSNEFSNVKSN